jgi:undecaprenyl pyrophosphate phosphatase UppP
MELIIALVLFIGLIGCWAILPGTSSSAAMVGEQEAASENTASARVSV